VKQNSFETVVFQSSFSYDEQPCAALVCRLMVCILVIHV